MNKYLDFFNLGIGQDDKQKVLDNVKVNISFRGANLWILACAIVVASIGLNVNSTAVIIGAMLISPLMGPIVGAGFGLGTFDFSLLKRSLKNLLIATAVGLFVSALYFFVSPFKDTQPELLSRTAPNIYDILIAFFGGLVGVIAITRVEKGNPIPGVAIATALMPPLCTAGYGLAIMNLKYFLGALYLYTINCVFICIATFLIVKYLRYPRVQRVDKIQQKRMSYFMTMLTMVLLLPGIYFAWQLFQQKKYTELVNQYITTELTGKGYTLLYKNTRYTTNPKRIELAFLSKKFSPAELDTLNAKLKYYGIKETKLIIRQDTTDLKRDILNEIGIDKAQLNEKDVMIATLQKKIIDDHFDDLALYSEAKVLFPEIESLALANIDISTSTEKSGKTVVALYQSKKPLPAASTQKMASWLEKRLKRERVQIFRQQIDTPEKK